MNLRQTIVLLAEKLARLLETLTDRPASSHDGNFPLVDGNHGCNQTVATVNQLRLMFAASQEFRELLFSLTDVPFVLVHLFFRKPYGVVWI